MNIELLFLEENTVEWEFFKKGVIQQIFSKEIRFTDEKRNNYPDWEIKMVHQIFDFISTNTFSRADMNNENGKVMNIHYGDIHTKYATILDPKYTEIPFINENYNFNNINVEQFCKDGDLVIADASEDHENIGKPVELRNVENRKILAGLHTILLRDKSGSTKTGYRGYMFLDNNIKIQLKRITTGVSVLGISKTNISKIEISLPSVQEQTKIANFLTSIDEKLMLLNSELKINKEFKKGLLQQMFC